MTLEQMDAKVNHLLLSGDAGLGSDMDASGFLVGSEDGMALKSDGFFGDLQKVASASRPQKRKSAGANEAQPESDSGDLEEDDDGSNKAEAKAWFDVASETQKFKRCAETTASKMKTRVTNQLKLMRDQLDVTRNMALGSDMVETKIAQNRTNALNIIANAGPDEWTQYCNDLNTPLACLCL